MPKALNFRSHFHDCSSRESVKARKDAALSANMSVLVKNTIASPVVLAGFHRNNEFFRSCLVKLTSETNEPVC